MKVFILPEYNGEDRADGGIRRVIEAMHRHLPEFGVQVARSLGEADVINCHGTLLAETSNQPIVASCHGLYWDDYEWEGWAHAANQRVVEVLVRATEITSPSQWVSKALARGLLRRPTTIYHGVEPDEWGHKLEHHNYVLWNKARMDPVSDPSPVVELARLLPHVEFIVTAFPEGADRPSNVIVIGPKPHKHMKEIIQRAGVYLATTRETFGIGTLEAMASGVPIVGWNYGGQREIVRDGWSGYLRNRGDYSGLAEAIGAALARRDELGANCRIDVRDRWQWSDKIGQYADLFRRAASEYRSARNSKPKVSVLVTSYNLGEYLPEAIASLEAQTLPANEWEAIIVDDASTDDSVKVARKLAKGKPNIHVHVLKKNVGLAEARNIAFSHSCGRYVIPLDADDAFAPDALKLLSDQLDRDPSIHIAYGHLSIMGRAERASWPPEQFDYARQVAHENQLPYSSMMRRAVLTVSGGYRKRDWRAEDAALWCRVTSRGFRARKVTQGPTLLYRIRSNSKSGQERSAHSGNGRPDGDWTWFTPWARYPKLTPWAAQGHPPRGYWRVQHLQHPVVTIIIPVGDGHEEYLPDALDSLLAQTMPNWDVIVVDDTSSQKLDVDVLGAPYATLLRTGAGGKKGPGFARNLGAENSTTQFILFLDADDYLVPETLATMLEAHRRTNASFVYSDGYQESQDKIAYGEAPDYSQKFWELGSQIPVTSLMSREAFNEVNGFDVKMGGWEDLDLYIKLAIAGHCGSRVAAPLLVYRISTGHRRESVKAQKTQLLSALRERYNKYYQGEEMCGCKGGSSTVSAVMTPGDQVLGGNVTGLATEILEYTGKGTGLRPFKGNEGRMYFGANSASGRRIEAHPSDVQKLLNTGSWRRPPAVNMAVDDQPITASPPPELTARPA